MSKNISEIYSKTITKDERERNEKSRLISKYFSATCLKENPHCSCNTYSQSSFPKSKCINSSLSKNVITTSFPSLNIKSSTSILPSRTTKVTEQNSISKPIEIINKEEIYKTIGFQTIDEGSIKIDEKTIYNNMSRISTSNYFNAYCSTVNGNSNMSTNQGASSLSIKNGRSTNNFLIYLKGKTKKNKMMKLYFDTETASDEISQRYINDELLFKTHCSSSTDKDNINESNYKLISSIKERTLTIPSIKKSSLLKLSHFSLYNILSFCFDNSAIFQKENNLFTYKVQKSLKNILYPFIAQFKVLYGSILNMKSFDVHYEQFIKNRVIYPVVNIVIKSIIVSTAINKSYSLNYSFCVNNRVYHHEYKFDVNSKRNSLWISTEPDEGHKYSFSSMQSMQSVITGDCINIYINLFSLNGIVNPYTLKWENFSIEDIPECLYEKSYQKTDIPFDTFRSCEIEKKVLFWRTESQLNNKNILSTIKGILKPYFTISKCVFDYLNFYYFKLHLKPKKVGLIPRSKLINCDIEIVDSKSSITKDIHNVYVMNILTNKIYVRMNKEIILYFQGNSGMSI